MASPATKSFSTSMNDSGFVPMVKAEELPDEELPDEELPNKELGNELPDKELSQHGGEAAGARPPGLSTVSQGVMAMQPHGNDENEAIPTLESAMTLSPALPGDGLQPIAGGSLPLNMTPNGHGAGNSLQPIAGGSLPLNLTPSIQNASLQSVAGGSLPLNLTPSEHGTGNVFSVNEMVTPEEERNSPWSTGASQLVGLEQERSSADKLAHSEATVCKLEKKLKSSNEKNTVLQLSFDEARAEYETVIASKNAEIEELKSEKEDYRLRLSAVQKSNDKCRDKYIAKIDSLTEMLQHKEEEINRIKEEFKDKEQKHQEEKAREINRISILKAEKAELKSDILEQKLRISEMKTNEESLKCKLAEANTNTALAERTIAEERQKNAEERQKNAEEHRKVEEQRRKDEEERRKDEEVRRKDEEQRRKKAESETSEVKKELERKNSEVQEMAQRFNSFSSTSSEPGVVTERFNSVGSRSGSDASLSPGIRKLSDGGIVFQPFSRSNSNAGVGVQNGAMTQRSNSMASGTNERLNSMRSSSNASTSQSSDSGVAVERLNSMSSMRSNSDASTSMRSNSDASTRQSSDSGMATEHLNSTDPAGSWNSGMRRTPTCSANASASVTEEAPVNGPTEQPDSSNT